MKPRAFAHALYRHGPLHRATMAVLSLLLAMMASPGLAHEYYTNNFTLVHPWSEATDPEVQEASVYCVLDNVQHSDRLLRAYSSLANSVEFRHSRQGLDERVDIIEIPAADSYAMSRTSSYLVLKELRAPLQWGRSYPMTMQFERAGFVNVMVSIGAH